MPAAPPPAAAAPPAAAPVTAAAPAAAAGPAAAALPAAAAAAAAVPHALPAAPPSLVQRLHLPPSTQVVVAMDDPSDISTLRW